MKKKKKRKKKNKGKRRRKMMDKKTGESHVLALLPANSFSIR